MRPFAIHLHWGVATTIRRNRKEGNKSLTTNPLPGIFHHGRSHHSDLITDPTDPDAQESNREVNEDMEATGVMASSCMNEWGEEQCMLWSGFFVVQQSRMQPCRRCGWHFSINAIKAIRQQPFVFQVQLKNKVQINNGSGVISNTGPMHIKTEVSFWEIKKSLVWFAATCESDLNLHWIDENLAVYKTKISSKINKRNDEPCVSKHFRYVILQKRFFFWPNWRLNWIANHWDTMVQMTRWSKYGFSPPCLRRATSQSHTHTHK